MEEKKENVVEMTPSVKAHRQPKNEKLPYDQLENIAKQLYEQLAKAEQEMKRLNQSNLITRVNILFKVVSPSKSTLVYIENNGFEIESKITTRKIHLHSLPGYEECLKDFGYKKEG